MQRIDRLQVGRLSYEEVEAPDVNTHTSNYGVLASDSGKLLVANKGGELTFTLPTVGIGKGCVWEFIQLQNQNLVIATDTADKMVGKNGAAFSTATFSTGGEKLGAACRIICDGTYYYFFNISDCTSVLSG